jgi:hypothetical protein
MTYRDFCKTLGAMMKNKSYISGVVSGALLMAALAWGHGIINTEVAASTVASDSSGQTITPEMQRLALPSSGNRTHLKFNDISKDGHGPTLPLAANYPIITLEEHTELASLHVGDVQSLCLMPMGSSLAPAWAEGFFIRLYLTPDGRKKIAAPLVGVSSKKASIRLMGLEAHNFTSSPDLAEYFLDNANSYTDLSALSAEGQNDERAINAAGPDVEYYVNPSGTFEGLGIAMMIAGKNLNACDGDVDLTEMPGFKYYQKISDQFVKLNTPN